MNPIAKHRPELDPDFLPASLWTRDFEKRVERCGRRPVSIALLRPDGSGSVHHETLLPAGPEHDALNARHLERVVKFLLWARGGNRVLVCGAPEQGARLAATYAPGGPRGFDARFVFQVFGRPLSIEATDSLPEPAVEREEQALGRHRAGCRIGIDLGGSDRKCAALIDGDLVFSEEVGWDPYFQPDPEYHRAGIRASIDRAARELPRVDAIGVSAAGVYVRNQVRVASLFRGVAEDLFEARVRNLFRDLGRAYGPAPLCVVNDGDVTALAGSMSIGEGALLGVAMGTSTAAGYVDADGRVTAWLSELAFVPVDYRPEAPVDEWSGDHGCSVQYLSQQAVSRLIPASGLEVDPGLPQPEKLVSVQTRMEQGDERAAAIYRTLGRYLGYAIPHFARFYEIRHLLVLGRVLSGPGGTLILEQARRVLEEEFPALAARMELMTLDERSKRHGQAVAAASLPAPR